MRRLDVENKSLSVTNSMGKRLFFHFRVANCHLDLLTRCLSFYFFHSCVTSSKLKNKKFHFELLIPWN